MTLALARVVDRRPWWRRALARLWGALASAPTVSCATCGRRLESDGDGCHPCGVIEADRQYRALCAERGVVPVMPRCIPMPSPPRDQLD